MLDVTFVKLLLHTQIWKMYKRSYRLLTCLSFLSSKLILTVDSTDDNYMPKRVTVFGGEGDNLKKLSDVTIDE